MAFSLYEVVDDLPSVHIVDVGASPIDGEPPYQRLLDEGHADVIGFEPALDQYHALLERKAPCATYLPYAIGDGEEATLNICRAPGMTSLLEPDMEVLAHFHGFAEWGRVVSRQKVSTRRLDDVDEVEAIDYLKLDVQGGELEVIKGAPSQLKRALVVHTEVQFVPFYTGQPLFAELDQALRQSEFYLHRFATPPKSRVFKPLMVNENIYAGLSQILWTDAVYVRQFTDFKFLSTESLLKIALIVHDLYGSFDLSALALKHADAKDGQQRHASYVRRVTGETTPDA